MRIAILISGRAARYDVCLLPLLKHNSNVVIDVFMSLNDENCNYYDIMKEHLKPWLKGCVIKKYIIPEEVAELFNPNESIATHKKQVNLQKINGKFLPNNCLSMYYNDNIAFRLACEYADKNNFEYDYYMKYRSDIINVTIPTFTTLNDDNIHLHCSTPLCNFISGGIYHKPIVSDAFSWGNRKTMNIYCNTYDFVIKKNKEYNGIYYIAFECSLTDHMYEVNIPITYHNIKYSLDKNRRMFDDVHSDTRAMIINQTHVLKITDNNSIDYFEADKQE
jgi:hypothetical protein